MSSRVFIIGIPALTAVSSPALAATAPPVTIGSALLQTIWALLVVIGIILVLYALTRNRFGIGKRGTGTINLVELRHIMPKTTLALVEVEGKRLLLGIGSGGISLLADLADEETDRNTGMGKTDFAALLHEKQEQ
ncbi:MAG TPA: hypothetical protein ENK84_07760 [Desulfobulbus sp.]|nr:hypothetical protein [Desulfobulbus sp.]